VHRPLVVLNGLGAVGGPGRLHRFVSHTGWTVHYASTIARAKAAVIAVSLTSACSYPEYRDCR
jgi:hypothetical protein